MSDNVVVQVVQKNGIGFIGVLTNLFIALKLTGVISWSWLWVISPLWIGFAIVLAIILIFVIFAILHRFI